MKKETFDLQPPEPDYVSEVYIVKVPVNDPHLKDRWELRKHATKLLEKQIGDSVQITSLDVKMPGLPSRLLAKLTSRIPEASLRLTVKF